jgi:hypothetical protein
MIQNLIPIAAALVSTAALLAFMWALRQPRNRRYVGPAADYWELVRRILLPLLARRVPAVKWSYELHGREYVGRINEPPEEVEQLLWDHGFTRMPLAAYKTLPDGSGEVGSWAFRESLTAEKQLHVMLFADGDGTAVYAHAEYSAINPLVALKHYRGTGYNPDAGAEQLRAKLPPEVWDAP